MEQQQPRTKHCPTCQTLTYEGTNYCYHCATPLSADAWQRGSIATKDAKRSDTWLTIVLGWEIFTLMVWQLITYTEWWGYYEVMGKVQSFLGFGLFITASFFIKNQALKIIFAIVAGLCLLLWIGREVWMMM